MNTPFRRLLVALAIALPAVVGFSARAADEFPEAWFWGKKLDRVRHSQMVGKKPPPLTVKNWLTKSTTIEEHKGKVILIDFWATWCGPCMKALPHNNELLKKYADKGLVIIAIHDGTSGGDRAPSVVKNLQIEYPLGIDDGSTSANAWRVGFWPTYAVIDRKGKIRAVGLVPDRVDDVIERLLDEPATEEAKPEAKPAPAPEKKAAPLGPVKPEWLEGTPDKRMRLSSLEQSASTPALQVEHWRHTDPLKLDSLKGKVVLLNFWGVWCPHCKAAVPRMNDLYKRYADQGLVVIGVTHNMRLNELDQFVETQQIKYPICEDARNATSASYHVDGYPDYFLIDRSGRVRVADVKQDMLEDAIKALLAEPAA